MPTFCEMSTIAWTSLTGACARRSDALTLQLAVADVLGDRRDVLDGALAGAGQTDVHRVDAEVVRELDEPQLVVDRRIDHRRRLDAVAQRLVEELDAALRRQRARPSRPSSSRRSARCLRASWQSSHHGCRINIKSAVAPTHDREHQEPAEHERRARRGRGPTQPQRIAPCSRRASDASDAIAVSAKPGTLIRQSGVAHSCVLRRPRRR